MSITNVPLIPRDPNGKLVVVVIGRISTPDQDKENIDASYRVVKKYLADIYRNPRHQYNFVQDAVDAGTRVICIGDNLDTADENWEVSMGTAALRHGLFIPDTRRRIRRTATDSFHKGG